MIVFLLISILFFSASRNYDRLSGQVPEGNYTITGRLVSKSPKSQSVQYLLSGVTLVRGGESLRADRAILYAEDDHVPIGALIRSAGFVSGFMCAPNDGGFDAAVTSTVAGGSGLSSSAALEVMLTGVFDGLFNDFSMDFVERAQISKRAENLYFGKPSGLLDQMASAAGGLVTVDFADEKDPKVEALQYDFAAKGLALAVVGTGGSHADLTPHYAAIPAEMKQVAACFGQKTLRGITTEQLMERISDLRRACGDRPVMRAFHFITEDARVPKQVAALKEDRVEDFLSLIQESGRSSFMYLQNVYPPEGDQSLSLALCMAENMLGKEGAWRIHGGGFAGTTLNFVPKEKMGSFTAVMDGAFGAGATQPLAIRPLGADMIRC